MKIPSIVKIVAVLTTMAILVLGLAELGVINDAEWDSALMNLENGTTELVATLVDPVAYADGVEQTDLTFAWSGLTRFSTEGVNGHGDLSRRSLYSNKYWDAEEWVISHNSFYETDAERCAAAGFSDALTFPFKNWPDEWGFYSAEDVKAEIWEELKTNPVYLYAVISALRECETRAGGTLGDWNSDWMNHYIDTSDYYTNPDNFTFEDTLRGDVLMGWDYWTSYSSVTGEIIATDEYKEIAILTMSLLDRFVVVGIYEDVNSTTHWPLNDAEQTDFRKPLKMTYPVHRPAIVFGYERKDSFGARFLGEQGTYDCLIGFDRHDKRPEIPGEPERPTPTREPEKTPVPTREPEKTPTPTREPEKTPVPTFEPEVTPTPTQRPTPTPEPEKTPEPTKVPPTPTPEPEKTPEPTKVPPTPTPEPEKTPVPTEKPTPEPTEKPTPVPTEKPTPVPTEKPTPEPTKDPGGRPQPTDAAPVGGGEVEEGHDTDEYQATPPPRSTTVPSTPAPTPKPTAVPTEKPTPKPTEKPAPTLAPEKPVVTPKPEIREDPVQTEELTFSDDD